MIGVSIVVCCYNSASRLPQTLKHLFKQKVDSTIPWEIVIVNNNSDDNTIQVATEEWQNYESIIPFRILDQHLPGLNNARDLGISSARFDSVILCDDDNWLHDNYVSVVHEVMSSDKNIGALGGVGIEECEVEPPYWFDSYKSTFAVGYFSSINGKITGTNNGIYGAGVTIRKAAYMRLKEKGFSPITTDRKGKELSSGGDTEIFWAIELSGYDIWFDSRLKFNHFIAQRNLTAKAFINKMYQGTRSEVKLRPYTYLRDNQKFLLRPFYKKDWRWLLLAHLFQFILKFHGIYILTFKYSQEINRKVVEAYINLGKIRQIYIERNNHLSNYYKIAASKWLNKENVRA